jgi:hypothetical protein
MRPTICSLFEPHHKQNLYTNPKRTAKSLIYYLIDSSTRSLVQKTFFNFQRIFSASELYRNLALDFSFVKGTSHFFLLGTNFSERKETPLDPARAQRAKAHNFFCVRF